MFGYKKLLSELEDMESRCLDRYEYLLEQVAELKELFHGGEIAQSAREVVEGMEKAEERWSHLCENFYRIDSMLKEFKGLVAIVRGETTAFRAVDKMKRDLEKNGVPKFKEDKRKPGRPPKVIKKTIIEQSDPTYLTKARDKPKD